MAEVKREVTYEIVLDLSESTALRRDLEYLRDDNRLDIVLFPLLEELEILS